MKSFTTVPVKATVVNGVGETMPTNSVLLRKVLLMLL